MLRSTVSFRNRTAESANWKRDFNANLPLGTTIRRSARSRLDLRGSQYEYFGCCSGGRST